MSCILVGDEFIKKGVLWNDHNDRYDHAKDAERARAGKEV